MNVDFAPSILDICRAKPLKNIHGKSWKKLLAGRTRGWRKSLYYSYDYEKQFPYTPNVRGVRTDEWKYVHYPNGDNKPDQYKAELYNLKSDPLELPQQHPLLLAIFLSFHVIAVPQISLESELCL